MMKIPLLMATVATLLAGCAGLPAPRAVAPDIYLLDALPVVESVAIGHALTLGVAQTGARPGLETPDMIYSRTPYRLDRFATSRWAEPPARMVTPLIVQAIEATGAFRAVVRLPGTIPTDLRLDTELVRLVHDFSAEPSRITITLRLQLVDLRDKRIVAATSIEESETAMSDDAYGGVVAANAALARVLARVARFAGEAPGRT